MKVIFLYCKCLYKHMEIETINYVVENTNEIIHFINQLQISSTVIKNNWNLIQKA